MSNIIQVETRLSLAKTLPLSLQHLFAMFGATVVVPYLFKIDPSTCILMNGIGTLIYIFVTKGKIPAYLGSSFAFIAPVFSVLAIPALGGYAAAQSGFIVAGILFVIISQIIRIAGTGWIDVVFPPAAMGAIVIIIGLELAPTAADMAGLTAKTIDSLAITVSIFTLAVAILASILLRKFWAAIPILFAVIAGYLLALVLHLVDLQPVIKASWFAVPHLYKPSWNWSAIFMIMPAVLVILAEHIGHLVVTGNIVERNLIENPGLHRSLLGDGISNILSGLVGSTPNTTYGENIGVMAITKVYSVWVIGGAAILAILCSFIGKLSALIHSIPVPVMGGICMLLFGIIAAAGIRMLVQRQVDYSKARNLLLTSVVLIVGLSGTAIHIGSVQLKGMGLATIVAIIISVIFALFDRLKISNDRQNSAGDII